MKIKQTGNELIVRETPGCLWIFNALFILVGAIFVYGSLGGFTNWDKVPWWAILFAFLMGAIALTVGIWMLFNSPVIKITINRSMRTVTLERYGLRGKQKTVYDFEQVKQFLPFEEKDSDGDSVWSLGMEFTSGKIEKISLLATLFQGSKQNFAFQINEFMQKQMPSMQSVLEIKDESDWEIR